MGLAGYSGIKSYVDHMKNSGPRRTFYRFRADMLELAVRLEIATDAVIAASFARSANAAELLSIEVLSGVPVQKRISTLEGVLERHELVETYPFVVPILRKLFGLRNALAHSIDDTTVDPGDGAVQLLGIRKGLLQAVAFEHAYLDWLHSQAWQVLSELDDLYWKIAPVDPQWHEN